MSKRPRMMLLPISRRMKIWRRMIFFAHQYRNSLAPSIGPPQLPAIVEGVPITAAVIAKSEMIITILVDVTT
jgi:hypothetical protein